MNTFLTDLVTIKRATNSTNAIREVTRSWATVASNVPCSIQQPKGLLQSRDAGDAHAYEANGYFAAGQDVRLGDHVVFGSAVFLVVHLSTPQSRLTIARLQRVRA